VTETVSQVRPEAPSTLDRFEKRRYHVRLGEYRGAAVHISLRPRLKIEAVMRSEIVKTVVDKMAVAARTGEVGDGKIFVVPVEDAVRIRTGEHGAETVQHAERAMWGH